MKKTIITAILIVLVFTGKACDICGCGVGSYYIGILPEFSKKIIGMRYRHNFLRTHIGVGGATTYLTTRENYSLAELWGAWNIGKKFRVMMNLPYNFNEKSTHTTSSSKNGIGDVSLSAYYRLINKTGSLGNKRLVQSLFVGAGIKLPTGKYNPVDKQGTNQNTNQFQLGTGSVDYSTSLVYDIRVQDVGLNLNANYKFNGTNKYHYCYGNKLSINTQLYYKWRIKNKFTVSPNIGVLYENAAKDNDTGFKVDVSGGAILCGGAGIEMGYKRIGAGANFQTPISQDLANGFVKAGNRFMVHIAYSF